MKKLAKFFTSSKFLLLLSFFCNVAIFALVAYYIGTIFYGIFAIVGLFLCLYLISRSNDNPAYKFTWILAIMVMPLFGTALYLYLKEHKGTKKQRKVWQQTTFKNSSILEQDPSVLENIEKHSPKAYSLAKYLEYTTNLPVYANTTSTYLKNGEEYFNALFDTLRQAKNFIFLEYFIIKPGKMWDTTFEILKQKAREGVDVKLIYDDFGCIDRFDDKLTFAKLNNHKIFTAPFNKLGFRFNQLGNYRDHRKIVVVDGKEALLGGINLADEYASNDTPFGVWKDAGIKISGPAVWNLSVMFLNNWELASKEPVDFEKYKVDFPSSERNSKSLGFVQPFGSGPLNPEPVHRNNYIKIINSATKELVMTTPYFILDNTIKDAIKISAKSGVKVKLIMPGIPDKKWVYYLSRSYYAEFIKSGVEIYEYTPGFVHEKIMLADSDIACVGSINLDFRSLYLHYEDGVVLYNSTNTINAIKQDLEDTLVSCHPVTLRDVKKRKWYEKLCGAFIKLFAPLM